MIIVGIDVNSSFGGEPNILVNTQLDAGEIFFNIS